MTLRPGLAILLLAFLMSCGGNTPGPATGAEGAFEAAAGTLSYGDRTAYRVGVTALVTDFTDGSATTLPDGAFNTSFASERFRAE